MKSETTEAKKMKFFCRGSFFFTATAKILLLVHGHETAEKLNVCKPPPEGSWE